MVTMFARQNNGVVIGPIVHPLIIVVATTDTFFYYHATDGPNTGLFSF